MHQGAVSCTSPIHKAQAALAASAAPARRTPQSPAAAADGVRATRRNHNQGPASMVMPLPSANKAISSAPPATLPASADTITAEYNKPQGNSAHSMPTRPGAAPLCKPSLCARAHKKRPSVSSHCGWRARHSSSRPNAMAAIWRKVQSGRSATDCTVSLASDSREIKRVEALWINKAQAVLDLVKKAAAAKGVQVRTVVSKSDMVSQAIITAAEKNDCDLIVMASHGRRGFKRLLLGSETQHVLTHTSTPVLVLR